MRALALCLLLAGCSQTVPDTRLICTVDGQEVYRSQLHPWLKFNNGVWWTRAGDWKYQPSAQESCRTEKSA